MKQTFVLKTSKFLLPILIGIFMVSGTLLCLPLLKNNASIGNFSYELSEGNAAENLSIRAKTNFVLPVMTIGFKHTQSFQTTTFVVTLNQTKIVSKDIFRNLLVARAP